VYANIRMGMLYNYSFGEYLRQDLERILGKRVTDVGKMKPFHADRGLSTVF